MRRAIQTLQNMTVTQNSTSIPSRKGTLTGSFRLFVNSRVTTQCSRTLAVGVTSAQERLHRPNRSRTQRRAARTHVTIVAFHVEGSLEAAIVLLGGEPALTVEDVRLPVGLIHHFDPVEQPSSIQAGLVAADTRFLNLTKVHHFPRENVGLKKAENHITRCLNSSCSTAW